MGNSVNLIHDPLPNLIREGKLPVEAYYEVTLPRTGTNLEL